MESVKNSSLLSLQTIETEEESEEFLSDNEITEKAHYQGRLWRNFHEKDRVEIQLLQFPSSEHDPVWISPLKIFPSFGKRACLIKTIGAGKFSIHLDHFEHHTGHPKLPKGYPSTQDGYAGIEVRFVPAQIEKPLEEDVSISLNYLWARTGIKIVETGVFQGLKEGFGFVAVEKNKNNLILKFSEPEEKPKAYKAVIYIKTKSKISVSQK